jgi:two-component system, NarL family, sensor histidine kinase BarA
MNGRIEVDSKLGEGSRFILIVPFAIGEKVTAKITRVFESSSAAKLASNLVKKTILEEKGQLKNGSQKKIQILLVEDDALAALMASRLLEEIGCEVTHVLTGMQALGRFDLQSFDLILMDLGLPDLSRFEVAQKIRSFPNEQDAETPIIALTGHMAADKRKACIEAGMQEMITKPLTFLAMQNLLTTYIDHVASPLRTQELPSATPAINLKEGSNLAGGKIEIAKQALDLVMETLPQDYQAIQKTYVAKDYEKMYQLIHKWYGGLCYCGVPRLRDIMNSLRHALQHPDEEVLPSLMEKLKKEVEFLLKEYKQLNQ